MPTLLEKGNILSPKGHDDEIPLDFIMNYFKLRIRGLGGETKKAVNMSDRVMILLANTGAGKSTTIPPELYIRFKDTVHCKNKLIGCTQPTRLNAVEIPQDVVKLLQYSELKLGETIGYQTGAISNKVSKGVLYMTIETVVEQIKSMELEDFLKHYSFIVIDEAHHRDLPTDVSMSLLKKIIKANLHKENCPFLVIMSATLDVDHFAKFFETNTIIHIGGKPYTIENVFPKSDVQQMIPAIIGKITNIHKEDLDNLKKSNESVRDILVFVPGLSEIEEVLEGCKKIKTLKAIPLYRENFIRGTSEFWDIFESTEKMISLGFYQRVIVSTAVAETGVTIPTIKYVIDSGWTRTSEFIKGVNCLLTKPASQSSAIQRKGRCGRKGPGIWHPLYTEETFKNMQKESYPDIVRGNATSALLDIFIATPDTIENVVRSLEFLDNPSSDSMNYSMEQLYILGAVNTKKVTDLGIIMSSCRMKLSHIRMILSGYVYGVYIPDLIIIAVGLLNKPSIIEDGKLYTLNSEILFKSTKISNNAIADEFIELLFLWDMFQTKFPIDKSKKWCKDNGLSYSGIMDWIAGVDEMLIKLSEMGFNIKMNLSLLHCKTDLEFVESISNIKRCILEGFKMHVATWDGENYVSNRYKFKVKSWSPILKVGNTPNLIIFDDTIMMYNKKLKSYTITVGSISVLDGWIAKEYDDRFTSARICESSDKEQGNLWEYKKATSIVPVKENPVKPNEIFEKLYEEKILNYSIIKGGYEDADVHHLNKKIQVFQF
jgi:HrpA-like RNA helicase